MVKAYSLFVIAENWNIKNEIRFWINLTKNDACWWIFNSLKYLERCEKLSIWRLRTHTPHTHIMPGSLQGNKFQFQLRWSHFYCEIKAVGCFFLYLFFSRTNPWSTLTRAKVLIARWNRNSKCFCKPFFRRHYYLIEFQFNFIWNDLFGSFRANGTKKSRKNHVKQFVYYIAFHHTYCEAQRPPRALVHI